MSSLSEEDAVIRFAKKRNDKYCVEHSNNSALNAYISNHDNMGEFDCDSSYSSSCSTLSNNNINILNNDENCEFANLNNKKYYHSRLRTVHIWLIIFITSLNHLIRKFYEYFLYFLSIYFGVSFYSIVWSIVSFDLGLIISSLFILPFIISRLSPHFMQFLCEFIIGISILMIIYFNNSIISLFILRFVFGICYILQLSNFSICIKTFIANKSLQSSIIGKIDLSYSFILFLFILFAYMIDNNYINVIFYTLSIITIISSFMLFIIMPSQKLINYEIDRYNFISKLLLPMISFFTNNTYVPTLIFLIIIFLITFINTILTLILAPWLYNNYSLTITEFGYCTIIIGISQIFAIIFSYKFNNKLGIGWSLLSGILIQSLMFTLIYLFNSTNIFINTKLFINQNHYTFPLLFILLILSIHFIAVEFTYINSINVILHITPKYILNDKNIAINLVRFITSISRIIAAISTPYIYQYKIFNLLGCILLIIAFFMHLILMLYITHYKPNNQEYTEYTILSSTTNQESNISSHNSYIFQINDDDQINDDINEEYIAKILSTNIDFI
eukprot:330957_1